MGKVEHPSRSPRLVVRGVTAPPSLATLASSWRKSASPQVHETSAHCGCAWRAFRLRTYMVIKFKSGHLAQSYGRRSAQVLQMCSEFERQKRGLPFRIEHVEGGRQGVSYGADARRVQYRHLVIRNVDGRPEVVRDELPDAYTDMDLEQQQQQFSFF